MVRSLYSGVSGLKTHQTGMDVIGNNIANVNSPGYKSSRCIFRDIFYQASINETGGSAAYAGNNPSTVGYGTQLGSIDKNMSGSNRKQTNKGTDCALNGDGFFIMATFDTNDETVDATAGTSTIPEASMPVDVTYTRLANMEVDSFGNLVCNNKFVIGTCNTADGLTGETDGSAALKQLGCLGTAAAAGGAGGGAGAAADTRVTDSSITAKNIINVNKLIQQAYNEPTLKYEDLQSFKIGQDGVITVMHNNKRKCIARIETAVFPNMDGLVEAGSTSFHKSTASGDATVKKVGEEGAPIQMLTGYLEMSNTNLADEFADMIVTQRGYQANARIITTSDSMLEELVNLKR